MNAELQRQLTEIARRALANSHDPAHDFNHALNVMRNAEAISLAEEADRDVTIAAALFHDIVHYLPNDHRSDSAPKRSATFAEGVLRALDAYPKGKIQAVREAILTHSAWLPFEPGSLEAQIVRDADLLEATGAVALMRTFACAGAMNLPLYSLDDPLCANRIPNRLSFALDYAAKHMTEVPGCLRTDMARQMARRRATFVEGFLEAIQEEFRQPALQQVVAAAVEAEAPALAV